MGFQFDPAKAAANLRKHKVSLADAEGVFSDPYALHLEDPDSTGEQRLIALGLGSAGEVLVVVYTMRGNTVRAISARKASRHERKNYESRVRLL